MPPESAKYLYDMLKAVRGVEEAAASTPTHSPKLVQSAVRWNLVVIGEALSQLRRRDPQLAERVTDHVNIVGLRNRLVHRYGMIDDDLVAKLIEEKSPELKAELEALLLEVDPE